MKKCLKLGKVSGENGIPNGLLKYCNIDDIVLKCANSLLLDGHKPQQWSASNFNSNDANMFKYGLCQQDLLGRR